MFGKRFFGTIALGGATVSLVGGVGSVFAEEIGPHDSNIVLTCKDGAFDYEAADDGESYYSVNFRNQSWSLQDLVKFFHLDRSETEKLLYRMGHCPGWCRRFYDVPDYAQIIVNYKCDDGSILIIKCAKHEYSGKWVYWGVCFNEDCVYDMLKTDLDTIDFSYSRPKNKQITWRIVF